MIVTNMTNIAVRYSHYQCINRIDEGWSHHLRSFLATNSANIYTAAAVLEREGFFSGHLQVKQTPLRDEVICAVSL